MKVVVPLNSWMFIAEMKCVLLFEHKDMADKGYVQTSIFSELTVDLPYQSDLLVLYRNSGC